MLKRRLGKSNIEVSAMGMGCWAIGGPWTIVGETSGGHVIQAGWGEVDDAESIRAIHKGLEMGVNFFDTAANYGAGHSERILGQALAGRRDQVVIATKFGYVIDGEKRAVVEDNAVVVENVRKDCEASLQRLGTDYIDLYQFHVSEYPADQADAVYEELEKLIDEGKIRSYGWSTDHPESAHVFAQGKHCTAIQHRYNVLQDDQPMLAVCNEFDLASVNRGPLLRGILTGKFTTETTFPANDVRQYWNLKEGRGAEWVQWAESLREILTAEGRTLAQGALCWIWARSERTVPIPGFKTIKQVEENAKAMEFGPLSDEQMQEIDKLLGRE